MHLISSGVDEAQLNPIQKPRDHTGKKEM